MGFYETLPFHIKVKQKTPIDYAIAAK